MSIKNGDMPASPQSAAIGPSGDVYDSESNGGTGLTKREKFAAMAMQGMCSGNAHNHLKGALASHVKVAVMIADALLLELSQ